MTPDEAKAIEYAELQRLQQIMACWPALKTYLLELRAQQVEKLIVKEDTQARGRINQLDELLQLPNDVIRAQRKHSGLSE